MSPIEKCISIFLMILCLILLKHNGYADIPGWVIYVPLTVMSLFMTAVFVLTFLAWAAAVMREADRQIRKKEKEEEEE